MTARQLRRALKQLDWTQARAADVLGVAAGQPRVSEWCNGLRPVPPYIAAHVRTLLGHQDLAIERDRAPL